MMAMRLKKIPCLILALALAAVAAPVLAEDKKGGEQLKHLQQKLRALEQEKSQLVQGKSELDGQLKAGADQLLQSKRSVDTAGRQRAGLEKELKLAAQDKLTLSETLDEREKKLADTALRLAETSAALQRSEASNRELEMNLTARSQSLAACGIKNDSLHHLGVTLLKKYTEKSCFDSGLEREMLTRLKRVGNENMLEEYREKLDQELITEQQQGRQIRARQQAAQLIQEQAALAGVQQEQRRAEQEKSTQLALRQQHQLDRFTQQIKDAWQSFEW